MKIFNESEKPVLFIDFDGTISKLDVIDEILKRFAQKRWIEIESEWVNGQIGSRECLRRQFELVEATPSSLNRFIDTMEMDEGFPALLQYCRDERIEVHIVSDGFDYYIRRMLDRLKAPRIADYGVRIWANQLIPIAGTSWRTDFPFYSDVCAHGCATCKPAVMRAVNPIAAPTVFIGDGLSDRFAAKAADLLFAKKNLSKFCSENGIRHHVYSGLKQVVESLDLHSRSLVMNLYRNDQSAPVTDYQ